MNNIRLGAKVVVFIVAFLAECAAGFDYKGIDHLPRSPWLGMEIWQSKGLIDIVPDEKGRLMVELGRAPFEFKVPARTEEDTIWLCASDDEAVLDNVRSGMKLEDVPFFAPGTGMADTEFASATLMLNRRAHHHFSGNRLNTQNGTHRLFFSSVSEERKPHAISEQMKPIFVVVFMDLNRNGVIDSGEYDLLRLVFA